MVVLDNCALVEIGLRTKLGLAVRSLILKNEQVVAPDLIVYEASSVCRKLVMADKMDKSAAPDFCSALLDLVDEFVPAEELREEALRESIRLNHSSYDLYYFVLARRTGATLITTDRKLEKLCRKNGVNCVAQVKL